MPTLTLKNLSSELHERLKEEAAAHRRSLNSEILLRLERSLSQARPSGEEIRRRASAIRARHNGPPVTLEWIDAAKRMGRP